MDMGEKVGEDVYNTDKFDKNWTVRVNIYYTGNHYNISAIIEENVSFLSKPDRYSVIGYADEKESVADVAEEKVKQLFESAKDREDAREISINVSVD